MSVNACAQEKEDSNKFATNPQLFSVQTGKHSNKFDVNWIAAPNIELVMLQHRQRYSIHFEKCLKFHRLSFRNIFPVNYTENPINIMNMEIWLQAEILFWRKFVSIIIISFDHSLNARRSSFGQLQRRDERETWTGVKWVRIHFWSTQWNSVDVEAITSMSESSRPR